MATVKFDTDGFVVTSEEAVIIPSLVGNDGKVLAVNGTEDGFDFIDSGGSIITGNLTSTDITVTGGTNAVVGSGTSLAIASNAVTTAKILDANVTTAKIADSNVTLAKIANIADARILGNNSGGAAAPIALTAAQTKTVLSLNNVENTALSTWAGSTNITTLGTIGTGVWNGSKVAEGYGGTNQNSYTTGDLLYASGANTLAKLAVGSTGNVLQVSGGVPAWVAPTGGWTTLAVSGSNFTTTGQALVDITGLSFSAVASTWYEIELSVRIGSSTNAGVQMGMNSTGTSPIVNGLFFGQTNATSGVSNIGVSANNTAQGTAVASATNIVYQKMWFLINSGTGSPVISARILKNTSGTATVYIGSVMRYRVFGT